MADALRRADATVCWATSADMCVRLASLGFDARPAGIDSFERRRRFDARYANNALLGADERRRLMFPKLFGEIGAGSMLAPLQRIADAFGPDVLLHDAAEFAAPIVAARLDVPHVTQGFGPLVPPDIVALVADEVAPLWSTLGRECPAFGGSYEHLYLDIYPPGMDPTDRSHVPVIQALRPMTVDATADDVLPEHVRALEQPLVYVTFGTVFNTPDAFRLVIDACRHLDCSVLLTTGPGSDPEAFGPLPANMIVERYIPQSLVLERCDVIVSHAGSGTFLQALSRGIPQLCLPQGADQHLNAVAGAGAGVAISCDLSTTSADMLVLAITRLLNDPEIRANTNTMATNIAAMPAPDDVTDMIRRLC
jgi:UDP:flavonoid glycosyltransferase YjiC (YdhE family)